MRDIQAETRLAMAADCTVRGIEQAREILLQTGQGDVRIECESVEQVDVTFVQLVVSAQAACAARGQTLRLLSVPECVRTAFQRASVELPPGPED